MPTRKIVDASKQLAKLDPVFKGLVKQHGAPTIIARTSEADRFESLARAIVFQQLAGKAAASIYARVQVQLGGKPTAAAVLASTTEDLRACGLSGAKEAALRDLAIHVATGELQLSGIGHKSDDRIIEQLVQVRGIGEWSAHMFMIFTLGRLDIWPTGDYGVRKGFGLAFGMTEMPSAKELLPLGDRFRPYRSLVAWYSWRAIEDARHSR